MSRRARWIWLLALGLLAGALRLHFATTLPRNVDEFHYVRDGLWVHASFPGSRATFLWQHARPHLDLHAERWELVPHETFEFGRTLIGHAAGYAAVVGLALYPWLHGAGTPQALTAGAILPARCLGIAADLIVLALLLWAVPRRWGPRVGVAAAVAYAVCVPAAAYAAQARPDPLQTALLVGAAAACTWRRDLACGVLLGAALVVKQSAVLFYPLALLALLGPRERGWPTRLVRIAAVTSLVAVAGTDLSAALAPLNSSDLPESQFPPDVALNLRGLISLNHWWMIGDAYGVLEAGGSAWHLRGTPLWLGALAGAVVLALGGGRRRLLAGLVGAAAAPIAWVSYATIVYRLLPLFAVAALVIGLGVDAWPRVSRRRRACALAVAALVALALSLRVGVTSAYVARYQRATQALAAGDGAAAQSHLAAARALDPQGAPALVLAGGLAFAAGDAERGDALYARALRDPRFGLWSPYLYPVGAYEALRARR